MSLWFYFWCSPKKSEHLEKSNTCKSVLVISLSVHETPIFSLRLPPSKNGPIITRSGLFFSGIQRAYYIKLSSIPLTSSDPHMWMPNNRILIQSCVSSTGTRALSPYANSLDFPNNYRHVVARTSPSRRPDKSFFEHCASLSYVDVEHIG